MRTRFHQRGKVTAPTLIAVGAALILGLFMGLYGAGVFQKKAPDPASQDKIEDVESSPKEQGPADTPKANSGSNPVQNVSAKASFTGPGKTVQKPGPKLSPTDPNFVPTQDPEPIEAPARDPEVPDMDPEPIKKN